MNLLCLDQYATLGGGQRSLIDLLPGFAGRGWRVDVAVPGDGPVAERSRRIGCHTHELPSGSYANGSKPPAEILRYSTKLPALVRSIHAVAARSRSNVLYVNGPRLIPAAAWVGRLRRIPVVFHCHNRISQRLAVRLLGASLRWAGARVIACCQFAAEPLQSYAGRRLMVLYNGVAGTPLSSWRATEGPVRIGVLGRIEPEKGQMDFVLAARSISRERPRCRFIVAGAPLFSGRAYLDRVIEASRGLPIEFLGWQDDVYPLLASLDVLVVPSSPNESAPRVILEAFAARVPVVAFPSGGVPEIVKDGETGFLTEAPTHEALAARIESVLSMSRESRAVVVANARAAWRDRFTLAAYRERVMEVLAEAAG